MKTRLVFSVAATVMSINNPFAFCLAAKLFVILPN